MGWRFVVLIFLTTWSTFGCSCMGDWGTVKQAWEKRPFVFLGTVQKVEPYDESDEAAVEGQLVRIRVDEAFKGTSEGQTIELREGGGSCSADLKIDQRAIFYVDGTRTDLRLAPCTHSVGSAEDAGDDLLFLRGLPQSALGTRLSGEVGRYEDSSTERFRRVGGVANLKVKITGPGNSARKVLTNGAGVYEVYGLLPGKYSVNIVAPQRTRINFSTVAGSPSAGPSGDTTVILTANGGASVDFVLQDDTEVTGRVLDAKGAPIENVCMDLVPADGHGNNGARFFDCSKKDGRFKMSMMTPGRYVLVARENIKIGRATSESTLYYPGVRERERAGVILIDAGHYNESLDTRVPSSEKRYKISGRVQRAGRGPMEGAKVRFTSAHGYTETAEIGLDGSFVLWLVAGMQGELTAQLVDMKAMMFQNPCHENGEMRFLEASPISLVIDGDRQGLKLELSSESCMQLRRDQY